MEEDDAERVKLRRLTKEATATVSRWRSEAAKEKQDMSEFRKLASQGLFRNLVESVNERRVKLADAIKERGVQLEKAANSVEHQSNVVKDAKQAYQNYKNRIQEECDKKINKGYSDLLEEHLNTLERLKTIYARKEAAWDKEVAKKTQEVLSVLETVCPLLGDAVSRASSSTTVQELAASQDDDDFLDAFCLGRAAVESQNSDAVTPISKDLEEGTPVSTKNGKGKDPSSSTKRQLYTTNSDDERPSKQPATSDTAVALSTGGRPASSGGQPPSCGGADTTSS
eukprot:jgi/Mesvir1/24079/Mv10801-RA.1